MIWMCFRQQQTWRNYCTKKTSSGQIWKALDLLGYFDCTQTIFGNPTKKHKNINKYLKDSHKLCKHLQDNGDVELEEQHEGGVVSSTDEEQPVRIENCSSASLSKQLERFLFKGPVA